MEIEINLEFDLISMLKCQAVRQRAFKGTLNGKAKGELERNGEEL